MIEMHERKLDTVENEEEKAANSNSLDPRVLSSVLISLKISQTNEESSSADPHARLLDLMHSTPVKTLLDAALLYAQREGIPPQMGLQQILVNLQEIDRLWNKVLIQEGVSRLGSQYH